MKSPKRVDLRFGYKCNNNCVFCVVQESRNKYKEMDTKQVKRLIKDSAEKGAEQLTFTGGEPTIRPDILELVKYAKSFRFKTIMFTTNGRMLAYHDFTQKIVDAGVNKFMVSLHAHNRELYAKITQSEEGFDQVVAGIKNIIKLKQDLCVSFVVSKHNYMILPEYVRFISNFGDIELMQMTYVMPCGGDKKLNMKNIPKLSDAAPYVKKVLDMKGHSIKDFIVMDMPICFLQRYERYINEFNIPDMEVHAANPEHSSEDYNLRRRTKKVKPEQCKACKHYEVCEGVWPEYLDIYRADELKPIRSSETSVSSVRGLSAKGLKVLLIYPPSLELPHRFNRLVLPPLGIGLMKAILEKKGHQAIIDDLNVKYLNRNIIRGREEINLNPLLDRSRVEEYLQDRSKNKAIQKLSDYFLDLLEQDDFDVVGISATEPYQEATSLLIAKRIKATQDVPIVIGGFVASNYQELLKQYNFFDYVIFNNYERSFIDLLHVLSDSTGQLEKIPCIAYKKGQKSAHSC